MSKYDTIESYENGFNDGWDKCHERFQAILKRFPMQCAMISRQLPLHPSQPDIVLEGENWNKVGGKI